MVDENLKKFWDFAAQYQSCWGKVQIAYVACLKSEHWISAQTTIKLCPIGFDDGVADFELTPTTNFTAGLTSVPLEEFPALVRDITDCGHIDVGSPGSTKRLFLTRLHAGLQPEVKNPPQKLQFQYFKTETRDQETPDSVFCPRIEIGTFSLEQGYWITDQQSLWDAGDGLRLAQPAFDGLSALLKQLQLRSDSGWWNHTSLNLVAKLPFRITANCSALSVECPKELSEHLRVVAFSEPDHRPASFTKTSTDADSTGRSTLVFDPVWGDDAELVRSHLYHRNNRLDEVLLRRWAGSSNWSLLIDSYFDPDQKHLGRVLSGADKESEAFEHAIVRLLTLLGFETIWYGKARTKGKPDLAGWLEASFNRRSIILGECTIDKPESKLSPLKARSDEIAASLGEGYRIIPIVFTPIEPAESDRKAALREGILILGKTEISELLSLLRGQRNPKTILESFERKLSEVPIIQWASAEFAS